MFRPLWLEYLILLLSYYLDRFLLEIDKHLREQGINGCFALYAFAVGDSQTLFHTSVWLRVSAKRFLWFPMGPLKSKKRSQTPDVFLMSGSVESFMISICRPVAVLYSLPRSYRSCLITSPLSPLIQTDCFSICTGQYASLKFRQA